MHFLSFAEQVLLLKNLGFTRRALLASLLTPPVSPLLAEPMPRPGAGGRLLVSVSAGTALDALARRVAKTMQAQLPVELEVENVPGAGGLVAAQRVLSAPADSCPLLFANSGLINVVPEMMKDGARFDPEADLAPLAILFRTPFVLFAAAGSGIRSIADLRAQFGRAGQSLRYGITPLYGGNHIAGHVLFQHLGLPAEAVAYTQASQLLLDVATQRVPVGIVTYTTLQAMIAQQRLHPLSVLSAERLALAPDVPSLREQGLAEAAYEGWVGLFHRRDLPAAATRPYAQALQRVFRARPPQIDALEFGFRNAYLDGAPASAFVHEDIARHRVLLRTMVPA